MLYEELAEEPISSKRKLYLLSPFYKIANSLAPRYLISNGGVQNEKKLKIPKLCQNPQSWTKVLTNLSKTNAFYPRPFVNSKNIFFLDIAQPPLPLFNVETRFIDTVTWLQH